MANGVGFAGDDQDVIFFPNKYSEAHVWIRDGQIICRASSGAYIYDQTIDHSVEKTSHIVVDDYNFDGDKEFAVWYMDEGMGVHKVYRVFIFSRKHMKFEEVFPSCGDEFLNLEINNNKKFLQSTFFRGNAPRLCLTKVRKIR